MAKGDDTDAIQSKSPEPDPEGDQMQNILLKRRKNSQLPISRLPTETLINIFTHYKMMLENRTKLTYWGMDLKYCEVNWMNIAYVYHHWRQVILNFPRFWAQIRLGGRYEEGTSCIWERVSTSLSRSQAVPLGIHAYIRFDWNVDLLVVILQCVDIANRIHELDVEACGSFLTTILECFTIPSITEGSPIRSLLIKRLQYEPSSRPSSEFLPKTFTSLRFPHLQRLKLWGCDFDWDSGVFKTCNLTSVAINPLSPSTQPTENQFLSFLRNLHLLEDLILKGYAMPRISGTSVSCINLPHLRVMEITSPIVSCFPLMRIITFPLTMANILLDCELSDFQDITRSPLLPFLNDYYETTSQGAAPTITDVVIDTTSNVPLLSIDHACGSGDSATNVCPALRFMVSNGSYLCSRFIDFIAASPLRFLRNLTLNHVELADDDQRRLLNCLVNLEKMQIDETSFSSIVAALTPARVASCGGEDQRNGDVYQIGKDSKDNFPLTVPASKLRGLYIYAVDMEDRQDQLLLCLEMRLQAGHGLSQLELVCCNLEEKYVELYRKVVSEVDWSMEYVIMNRGRWDYRTYVCPRFLPDA